MRASLIALAAALTASAATAATVNYGFEVDFQSTLTSDPDAPGTLDEPFISIENISDVAEITGFTLTLPGTAIFDFASRLEAPADGSFTFATRPTGNNGSGVGSLTSDVLTDFDPGEFISFFTEVDSAPGAQDTVSILDILEGGGEITVDFRDEFNGDLISLSAIFEPGNFDNQSSFPVISTAPAPDPAAIPLPAGAPLLLLGLGALGIARRRTA